MNQSLITFPCSFAIKVLAVVDTVSEASLVDTVLLFDANFNPSKLTKRFSKGQKYCAFTFTVWVHNQEHLDALYQALYKVEGVKMML